MTYEKISRAVAGLVKKYDERDPFRLCRAMGIKLIFLPMGREANSIKGFFLESKRIRTITVNSDLPQIIQKIIVAHEICHAVLHRKSGIQAFHEITLFDHTSIYEKEANLFAAELLLQDTAVMEVVNGDTTFFSAAAVLTVPPELLDFKFRVMKWKGFKMTEPPINAQSNFLKDMEITDDAEYCF